VDRLKVDFVVPHRPSLNAEDEERPWMPPLGISLLRAMTPETLGGFELVARCHHEQTMGQYSARSESPDILALSMTTGCAARGYEIVAESQNASSWRGERIRTLLGGPHVSALPLEGIHHGDAVALGETPPVLMDAILHWLTGQVRAGSSDKRFFIHHGNPRTELLDRRPVADRSWYDPCRYYMQAALQTSAGCPFDCDFCAVGVIHGHRQRHVDYADLQAEAAQIHADGLAVIVDDNFLPDSTAEHARRVCSILKSVGIRWTSEVSPITLFKAADSIVPILAESGCVGLYIGVESITAALSKSLSQDRYRDLVRRLHDHGIATVGFFVFGLDSNEGPDIFERTVRWSEKNGFDAALFFVKTPLPGSRDFEIAVRNSLITDWNWDHYNNRYPVRRFDHISSERMYEGVRNALRWHKEISNIVRRGKTGLQRLLATSRAPMAPGHAAAPYLAEKMREDPAPNPYVLRQLELGILSGSILSWIPQLRKEGIPITETASAYR
jgi:radical SAM superfamily enzyme YgiQ (UPF0313 family)